MKHTIKLLIAAVLSLSAGIAFASPLYYSDIHPFPWGPQGQKANMSASIVFANFTVQPPNPNETVPPNWQIGTGTPVKLTYNVVLNVTNNSNMTGALSTLTITAAHEFRIFNGSVTEWAPGLSGVSKGLTGAYRGAWLDGQWINVTWIPEGGIPNAPNTEGPQMKLPFMTQGGYWREGVEISATYTNGQLTQIWMLLNGTWTDVKGRVQVPDLENPFDNAVNAQNVVLTQYYGFANTNRVITSGQTPPPWITTLLIGPGNFDDTWQPGQSRLILLSGTCFARDANVSSYLQEGHIAFRLMQCARQADTIVNGNITDTAQVFEFIKDVPLQLENGAYTYNAILSPGELFRADKWGVEVFVEPGS